MSDKLRVNKDGQITLYFGFDPKVWRHYDQAIYNFVYHAALRAEGNGDSLDFNKAYEEFKKYWIVE